MSMLDQSKGLKLLIISRDLISRAGLSYLLSGEAGVEMEGQDVPGHDLENTLDAFYPDLILWDLDWDDSHSEGSELQSDLEQISDLASDRFSIMTLVGSHDAARDAWIAGAKAILLQNVNLDHLRVAINASLHDLVVLDVSVGSHLPQQLGVPQTAPTDELTLRELQVLQQFAQ